MPPAGPESNTTIGPHPLATPILVVVAAIVVFTPIFRAGATPLAGLVSQLLALLLVALVLWAPTPRRL